MLTSLLIIVHALQSAEGKGQPNTVELIRQHAVPLLPATAAPAAPQDSWRTSCSELSYHDSSDEFSATLTPTSSPALATLPPPSRHPSPPPPPPPSPWCLARAEKETQAAATDDTAAVEPVANVDKARGVRRGAKRGCYPLPSALTAHPGTHRAPAARRRRGRTWAGPGARGAEALDGV
jgi:hypothetical protein